MTPTYNVTYKEIENYIKKGYLQGKKDAIKMASDFSLAAPMLVLKDIVKTIEEENNIKIANRRKK